MKKHFLFINTLLFFTNSIHSDSQNINKNLNSSSFQEATQATVKIPAIVKLIYINDPVNFNSVMIDLVNASRNNYVHGILLAIDASTANMPRFGMLQDLIKNISARKPVVALITGVALSGGYMAASAANYIIAGSNSEIGEIGICYEVLKYKV